MAIKYWEVEYLLGGKRAKTALYAATKVEAINIARQSTGGKVLRAQESVQPLSQRFNELKDTLIAKFAQKKVDIDALISAIRQIAVMANAGISFSDILYEAAASTDDKRLKQILQSTLFEINAGLSFSEALGHFEYEVGKLTITMIELGEKTGTLAEALESLANILEEIRDNRTKLKKALRYPLMTIGAMSAAFTVLIIFVVPKFKSIFEKFKTDLPVPTKILLALEHYLSHYGLLFIVGFVVLVLAVKYLHKNHRGFRYGFDKYILKVYLIGEMTNLALVSRFTIVFKELNKAGLPISDALSTSIGGVENTYIKQRLQTVIVNIQRGMSLTEALREAQVYENMILQMIAAGEQSGSLAAMLEKTADYYRRKFQVKMDTISSSIEPILIALISGFVLLLALGIFMPMWDMAKVVKGG